MLLGNRVRIRSSGPVDCCQEPEHKLDIIWRLEKNLEFEA